MTTTTRRTDRARRTARRGLGRRGFLRGLPGLAVAAITGPVIGHARALPGVTVTFDNRTGGDLAGSVDDAIARIRRSLSVMSHRARVTAADIEAAVRKAVGDGIDVVECVRAEDGSFQVRARLRDNLRAYRYRSNVPSDLRGLGRRPDTIVIDDRADDRPAGYVGGSRFHASEIDALLGRVS